MDLMAALQASIDNTKPKKTEEKKKSQQERKLLKRLKMEMVLALKNKLAPYITARYLHGKKNYDKVYSINDCDYPNFL